MAQDIVGGLFGVPEQPNYYNQDYQTAVALANANSPKAMGRFLGGMIGAPIGRAVAQGVGGLMGYEDPRMKQQKVIELAKQQGFDTTTPEGLQQIASFFVQNGEPGLASQVASQMQQMQKTTLDYSKTAEDYQREKAFREAVSQIPPEQLTEEVLMQLAAKFGTTSSVMSAMANLTGKREAIAARQEAAQAKVEEKKAATEEKTRAANANALAAVMPVMDTIEKAIPLVGYNTAGWGSFMKYLPGTEAKDLDNYIGTIKANLGFQQLQAMRQASPTGGALGQVAVKELEALQSTIASLDPSQKKTTLLTNLKKVQNHYLNWKKTLEQQLGQEPTSNTDNRKEQWMAAAKSAPQNKNVSEAELSDYYDKKYGGK